MSIRIALAINEANVYGRGLLRGIYRRVRPTRTWRMMTFEPRDGVEPFIARFRPDAVLAQVWGGNWHRALQDLGVPVVNTSGGLAGAPYPTLTVDNHAVGRMAAESFLEKGFHRLGFVGDPLAYSQNRLEGFAGRLAEDGLEVARLNGPISWGDDPNLARWLEGLDKPVGLFAANDRTALLLAEACHFLHLAVPDEVAILGVDNDDVCCHLPWPPLSSIELPLERIGSEAVDLLQRLLDGEDLSGTRILLPPVGVVARGSTDVLAVGDADVAAALRYIGRNAHRPLRVPDVLRAVPSSRRSLEVRFRRHVGRSLLEHIRRSHLALACRLLRETDLPVGQVAAQAGYRSASRMCVEFSQRLDLSPLAYRLANRKGRG